MSISVLSGFKVGSTDPIDSRFVMTKAQMAAIADSVMPEVYITVCSEDGKLYAYKKDNRAYYNHLYNLTCKWFNSISLFDF